MAKFSIGIFKGCPVRYLRIKGRLWFATDDIEAILLEFESDPSIQSSTYIRTKLLGNKIRHEISSLVDVINFCATSESRHANDLLDFVLDVFRKG